MEFSAKNKRIKFISDDEKNKNMDLKTGLKKILQLKDSDIQQDCEYIYIPFTNKNSANLYIYLNYYLTRDVTILEKENIIRIRKKDGEVWK